jgi:hypothetical protein
MMGEYGREAKGVLEESRLGNGYRLRRAHQAFMDIWAAVR